LDLIGKISVRGQEELQPDGFKLLGILTSLLRFERSGGSGAHPLPQLTAIDGSQVLSARDQLLKDASNRQRLTPTASRPCAQPAASNNRWLETSRIVSTRRWVTPTERAAAILDFLQGPGGRTGTFTCAELEEIHSDICLEQGFEPIGWTAVGRELRKLIGGSKDYQRIHGRQARVYRIPPKAQQALIEPPEGAYFAKSRRRASAG
jgi:hypothetical protein